MPKTVNSNIYWNENELIEILTKHIKLMYDRFSDESMRVSASMGIDTTVLVKGVQVLHSHGMVVGLAHPNK